FSIKITYQVFKTNKKEIAPITEKMEFEVPIIMNDKEFLAETITLTPTNTAIKTDTSIRRKQEINTLHDIINTINRDAIHHLEPFICPVKATRRTSTFGDQRTYAHSNGTSSTSIHYGIDFGVPIGTAVHACGAGKVVLTENRVSSGLSIVIEHLPGLYSLYYHLDEFLVKEGDVITQGQEIAKSGNTGLSTGPHLHWEMRMLGHAVNPDWFVEKFTIMMQN
ncbi:MAG TPA: M23 family metallopeptidase, partial [Treponemataceae bacterium]|nr:M23 family metallopeptidase [Treponemataceae bacterium]